MGHRSRWIASAALIAATGIAATGCAHSEEEWQAQLHTVGDLRARLEAEQAQAKKARAALDDSTAQREHLEQELRRAGVDVANLGANLEKQARAAEEYRRHGEQLEGYKRRFEALRVKLAPLGAQGVSVTVRNNRVVIELPASAFFDAGREALKREGREILLKVAEVIRGDPGLGARTYQIAGHVGHVDEPPAGGRFKDNVGLSAMRAREALALLVQPVDKGGGGLNPSRWSAAGYGGADPLRASGPPESSQANQRLEIVVQPAVEEVLDLKALVP